MGAGGDGMSVLLDFRRIPIRLTFLQVPLFRPMSDNLVPTLPKRLSRWAMSRPFEGVAVLCLIALLAGFYGLFEAYGPGGQQSALAVLESSWNDETDYSHGYLVGPLILVMLAIRFWKRDAGPRDRAMAGLAVLCLGLVMWVVAYRVLQWRVAVASLSVVVWGMLWFLCGWRTARATFLPVFFLWLAIPVPGLVQATNGLQVLATKFGYLGSQLFGVEAIHSGTNIQSAVAGKWGFDIAEGCSGIRSLMAMVLIAAVYIYLIDLPVWRKVVVFAAALPLAILVNAVRITSILVLGEYASPAFAAGIYHNWASFFIFPLGIVGMLGVHQLLTLDRRVRRRVVRRTQGPAAPQGSATT